MKGWIEVNVVQVPALTRRASKPLRMTHVQQVQVANINSFGIGQYGGKLHMKGGDTLNTTESYEHLQRLIGFANGD